MDERNNLALDVMDAVAGEKERTREYSSEYEAYAILKQKAETAEQTAGTLKKLMDELWKAVKERNGEAVAAYASQLASDARNAAVAYAALSAAAARTADI